MKVIRDWVTRHFNIILNLSIQSCASVGFFLFSSLFFSSPQLKTISFLGQGSECECPHLLIELKLIGRYKLNTNTKIQIELCSGGKRRCMDQDLHV
jgi:hypothetical protein